MNANLAATPDPWSQQSSLHDQTHVVQETDIIPQIFPSMPPNERWFSLHDASASAPVAPVRDVDEYPRRYTVTFPSLIMSTRFNLRTFHCTRNGHQAMVKRLWTKGIGPASHDSWHKRFGGSDPTIFVLLLLLKGSRAGSGSVDLTRSN